MRFGDDVTELMIEEGASDDAESFAYDNMLNGIYQYDIADEKTTCLTEIDHINDLSLLDGDGYYSSKDGYFVFAEESKLPPVTVMVLPFALFSPFVSASLRLMRTSPV